MRKLFFIPYFFLSCSVCLADAFDCSVALRSDTTETVQTVATVKARPSLEQRLRKVFPLGTNGAHAFFNGLLVQATNRKTLQSGKILILSDYVGSQHRLLFEKIKRKGFTIQAFHWAGEIALTLRGSTVAVSSINNCSGFIHEALIPLAEHDPSNYALRSFPDISNLNEEFLLSFLSTSFPALIDSDTQVFPYSRHQEHLMKVDGIQNFDPKHIDPIQGLEHLLLLYSPQNWEGIRLMMDRIELAKLFIYFDAIIQNLRVTKFSIEEWNNSVHTYNNFKLNFLLFDDAQSPTEVINFFKNEENWATFIRAVQAISKRAYTNPDARFLMLSVSDAGQGTIF